MFAFLGCYQMMHGPVSAIHITTECTNIHHTYPNRGEPRCVYLQLFSNGHIIQAGIPSMRGHNMGHYWSEMGPPTPAKPSAEVEEARDLRKRGYTEGIEEMAVTGRHLCAGGGSDRSLQLRLHRPCGLAVFDPDTHDNFCPARKR